MSIHSRSPFGHISSHFLFCFIFRRSRVCVFPSVRVCFHRQVDIVARNAADHRLWFGWIESRMRNLLVSLDQIDVSSHGCGVTCTFVYCGVSFDLHELWNHVVIIRGYSWIDVRNKGSLVSDRRGVHMRTFFSRRAASPAPDYVVCVWVCLIISGQFCDEFAF